MSEVSSTTFDFEAARLLADKLTNPIYQPTGSEVDLLRNAVDIVYPEETK